MKLSRIALLSALLVSASIWAVSCKEGPYVDGQYSGQGRGNADVIIVEVSVKGGYIADLSIKEQHETDGLFNAAFDGVKKEILTKQTWEVDSVSGASHSSEGIKEAVKAALANAKKQ